MKTITILLLLACLQNVSTATAAVIYSTIATASPVSGEVVGQDPPDTYEIADSFVPAQNFQLTLGIVAISRDSGTAPLVAHLWSNSGTSPGTILDTASVAATSVGTTLADVTLTFSGNVVLLANTTYWFSLTSTSNTEYDWRSSSSTAYPEKYTINGGAWRGPDSPMSAFELQGTVVPEPSALTFVALMAAGASVLVARSRMLPGRDQAHV